MTALNCLSVPHRCIVMTALNRLTFGNINSCKCFSQMIALSQGGTEKFGLMSRI
jgi:hypothetical protein